MFVQHGFEQRKKEGEISCSLGKGNKGTLSKYNYFFACTNLYTQADKRSTEFQQASVRAEAAA